MPQSMSCLRARQWELGTLELYRLGKHGAIIIHYLVTSRVLFEGLVVGAGSFGTIQLR